MKVSYEYTKEEYKKHLLRSRIKWNIILFIVGIILYLYFYSDKVSYVSVFLCVMTLILIIVILNTLYIWGTFKAEELLNYNLYGKYILELTPNKFSLTVNNKKTDYKYKQVKKIVDKKKYFVLKFNKSRESLIFEKNKFKEKDYIAIINMFKDKIKL